MSLPIAHIAGIPVEETLLSFGPVFAVGGGAAAVWLRDRRSALRERLRHPPEDDAPRPDADSTP